MNSVTIDAETCKGCGLCARACPRKILRISQTARNTRGYYVMECFEPERCTACRSCALTCPDVCITVFREG